MTGDFLRPKIGLRARSFSSWSDSVWSAGAGGRRYWLIRRPVMLFVDKASLPLKD